MGRANLKMVASCRCLWMAGALALAASIAAADAQQGCPDLTYSKFLGTKKSGAKYVDHTQLSSEGSIVQVSLYYNKGAGCLRGFKAVYGQQPRPGMIGTSANSTEEALKLKDGEYVTKADYKATRCIEYVKLTTNQGRSVSVGSASAPAALATTAANKTGGRLVAIRGFQAVVDSKPGALQQLQFAWGSGNCPPPSAAAAAAAAAAADLDPESSSNANSDPSVCAPKTDMCDEQASMNQFSYCVWNPPYTKSACRGGCCLSSGKCASSSCAISGVGKDVANMICYGTNNGIGFGGSELCSGLACKLATTGCTTDAFGGNCVGTVVHYAEQVAVHPDSQKYVGATCLDATPSDYTLDANGEEAGNDGIYMSKLWTICDCSTDGSDPYAGVPNVMNLTGMSNLTKNDVLLAISQVLPKVNLTSVVDSVTKGSDDDNRMTELFPSITGIFKKPTAMPTITLPSFFGGDHHAAGSTGASTGNSSEPSAIQFKLPDLSTLLSTLAARAANASKDSAATATEEPSLTPPVTPVTIAAIPAKATLSAAKTAAEALTGLRGFLGKIMPALTNSNMRTADHTAAPVAIASEPPTAAQSAAAAPEPAPKASTTPASVAAASKQAPAAATSAEEHTTQTVAALEPAKVNAPQQPAAAAAAEAPKPAGQQQQQAVAPTPEPVKQSTPAPTAAAQPPTAAAPVPEEPQQQQPEQQKKFNGFSGLSSALANYRPVQYYEYEPYEHPAADAAHPAGQAANPPVNAPTSSPASQTSSPAGQQEAS